MLQSQQSVLKAAVKTVLDQKLNILRTISQQDYVHFHAPVFNASVGGHIRHVSFCLFIIVCLYPPPPPPPTSFKLLFSLL